MKDNGEKMNDSHGIMMLYCVCNLHRVPVEEVRAPPPPLGVAPGPHVAQGRAHILLCPRVVHVEVRMTRP